MCTSGSGELYEQVSSLWMYGTRFVEDCSRLRREQDWCGGCGRCVKEKQTDAFTSDGETGAHQSDEIQGPWFRN